jgi:hypothetical protein
MLGIKKTLSADEATEKLVMLNRHHESDSGFIF